MHIPSEFQSTFNFIYIDVKHVFFIDSGLKIAARNYILGVLIQTEYCIKYFS